MYFPYCKSVKYQVHALLYYISIMRHISYNPKNTVDRNGFQTQEALTQWSCVVHVRVCDLSVEEVVKNFNLLLQLVLGWQEAMLLELQQASVYNITEDWIWPHCKCLNLVVLFLTIRFVLQTLASSVLCWPGSHRENSGETCCVSSCACTLEQYCSHRQNECI